MPTGSFRWCKTCEHRWYVALPLVCSCPKCGTEVADASDGWPHMCTNGCFAQHGGLCFSCLDRSAAKAKRGKEKATR